MTQQLFSHRFSRQNTVFIRETYTCEQQAMIGEMERRLSANYQLVDEPCPCGAAVDEDVAVAEIDRYGLPLTTVLCRRCGALRTNPYLDDPSLSDFYRTTYQTMYTRSQAFEYYFTDQYGYGERIRTLYGPELPRGASVLEVGCGTGGALAAFQEHGYRVAGCELSRNLIDQGTATGVNNLWYGELGEMPRRLRSRKWDLIYLHHVFEHVQSPLRTLAAYRELLAPGGRVLVIVPDVLHADVYANPGGDLLRFLHVAHKFNFTPACLEQAASRTGLTARVMTPPAHLSTVWSEMAELWMEFRHAGAQAAAPAIDSAGDQVLAYLMDVERRFMAGETFGFRSQPPVVAHASQLLADARKKRGPARRLWRWVRGRALKRAA